MFLRNENINHHLRMEAPFFGGLKILSSLSNGCAVVSVVEAISIGFIEEKQRMKRRKKVHVRFSQLLKGIMLRLNDASCCWLGYIFDGQQVYSCIIHFIRNMYSCFN